MKTQFRVLRVLRDFSHKFLQLVNQKKLPSKLDRSLSKKIYNSRFGAELKTLNSERQQELMDLNWKSNLV